MNDPGHLRRGTVIVGAGAGGLACGERLRELGYTRSITLIDPDPDHPYDRPPLSKDVITRRRPVETARLRTDAELSERGIEVLRASALELDVSTSCLRTSQSQISYNRLVLACGSTPRHLDLHTVGAPGQVPTPVQQLFTLQDARSIRKAAGTAHQALVIGGGFVGSETAAGFRQLGIKTDLLIRESAPMLRQLGPEVAAVLADLHIHHGVRLVTGRTPTSSGTPQAGIRKSSDGVDTSLDVDLDADSTHTAAGVGTSGQVMHRVHLDDGTSLEADLIVAGIGSEPNTGWLRSSAVPVHEDGTVNAGPDLSVAPGVWAIGDIVTWPSGPTGRRVRSAHWTSAKEQARHVAAAIAGSGVGETFDTVPYFWSTQYRSLIQGAGVWSGPGVDISVQVNAGPPKPQVLARYTLGTDLIGVVAINAAREFLTLKGRLAPTI